MVVDLNLIALQKTYWLIENYWGTSTQEIIESLGIEYGESKNALELMKSLNAKKDDAALVKIVNTVLLDTDLQRAYESGWNINFVWVKDVVDGLLKLLENDGYKIESFQIKWEGEPLRPPLYADILESKFVKDKFYSELIGQINTCYRHHLFPVVAILFRKILENLVIDILRYKYGSNRMELFFYPNRHRHHDFAVLLKNLRDNVSDFQHYSGALNDKLFDMLEKFREQGNANTHSIDVFLGKEEIDNDKQRINYLIGFLYELMQKVKSDSGVP